MVLAFLSAGCVSHPVGPARSFGSYEAKARTTAESARTSIATARLIAETARDGKTFGGFASVSIAESEDALVSTIGTFGSIQPPDDRSQQLRGELSTILNEGLDEVAATRIEIRRGHFSSLDPLVEKLTRREDVLSEWLAAHGSGA